MQLAPGVVVDLESACHAEPFIAEQGLKPAISAQISEHVAFEIATGLHPVPGVGHQLAEGQRIVRSLARIEGAAEIQRRIKAVGLRLAQPGCQRSGAGRKPQTGTQQVTAIQ